MRGVCVGRGNEGCVCREWGERGVRGVCVGRGERGE